MKSRILIVEDQTSLLHGLTRGLETLPEVSVTACSSAEEALSIAMPQPPEILITDMNLPGRSGLELVSELRAISPNLAVIAITAYLAAYASALSKIRGLWMLEKPVRLDDLRRTVEGCIAERSGTAQLGPFQVSEVLQLAQFGHHSVVVEVVLQPGEKGTIEVVDGSVWSAECGLKEGREALEYLLTTQARAINCRPLANRPVRRDLQIQLEQILLEMAHAQDEATHRELLADPKDPFDRVTAALLNDDLVGARVAAQEARHGHPEDDRHELSILEALVGGRDPYLPSGGFLATLELCHALRADLQLVVRAEGGATGVLQIRGGAPVHAEIPGDSIGIEALLKMAFWPGLRQNAGAADLSCPVTIDSPFRELRQRISEADLTENPAAATIAVDTIQLASIAPWPSPEEQRSATENPLQVQDARSRTSSALEATYARAVDAYQEGRFQAALDLLGRCEELQPGHAAVRKAIQRIRRRTLYS